MGKYSAFAYVIFTMFLITLSFSILAYWNNCTLEVERIRLGTIVNNATDSAIREAVSNENITIEEAIVRPDLASDIFFRIFMTSYDMSLTEENLVKCYEYVPLLALISNDGIFLGYPRIVNNNKWEFHWEPKIPYVYETSTKLQYLTITGYGRREIDKNGANYVSNRNNIVEPSYKERYINDTITQAVRMGIARANEANPGWKYKFYVPEVFSDYSVVGFHGTTLLAFVQNVDINTRDKLDYFGVGGTQITKSDKVVCYTDAGTRYYCYASNSLRPGFPHTIHKVYDKVWEAAEAGYQPDLRWIT